MTFNTEWAFKLFLYWKEDGESFKGSNFVRSILWYLWYRYWWLASIYNVARYSTLAYLPPNKRLVLEFYLGDWGSIIKGLAYRFIIMIGPLFSFWQLLLMPLLKKLMSSDKRYRYWLRYLQIPATRMPDDLKLPGCSKNKIAEFWKFAAFLESLLFKVMTIQSTFMISCFCLSYVVNMQTYGYLHSPFVFWTILMTNSIFLATVSVQCLLTLYTPMLYLFLISRLLKQRLLRTTARLKHLSTDAHFNSSKVDRYLHHFGSIVDEIQRSNFFWCKYLTLNYHIATFILSLSLLCAILNYKDTIMMFCAALVFVLNFTNLAICLFVCGDLHVTIKSTYQPLTRLMANKRLKLSANLRIVRLLDFIMSEHAGFRCASLFLIRKHITLDIPCHIVVNTLLLFNMIFYIFIGFNT